MTMQQILKEREVNRYGIEIETTVLSIYVNASLSFALFRFRNIYLQYRQTNKDDYRLFLVA